MGGCASLCSGNVPSEVGKDCFTQITMASSTTSVSKESCNSSNTFKIKHIKSLDDVCPSTWENVNLFSNNQQSMLMTNDGVPVLMLSTLSSPTSSTTTTASIISFKTPAEEQNCSNNKSDRKSKDDTISKSNIPFILIHQSSATKLNTANSMASIDYDYLVPEVNG